MSRDQPRLPGISAKRRRTGRIRRGLDETLAAMRVGGLLEPIDAALVALARVAADELDEACRDTDESRYTRATLIARYAGVLETLVAHDLDDGGPTLDELLSAMDDPETPGA
jgi:hypothetical protein